MSANTIPLTSSQREPPLDESVGRLDTLRSPQQPDVTVALFILHTWNFDMFWTSLHSYVAAGLGARTIVIDNSAKREALNDPKVAQLVGEVIPTRVQLSFSQLQNFAADVAAERNLSFYFWGHVDAAVLASQEGALFGEEALACMDRIAAEEPSWGVVYFRYDTFAAFRTEAARAVRWDNFIHHYLSDCDWYPRVRAAGWATVDAHDACNDTNMHVYKLRRPVILPLHDYARAKALLEAEEERSDIDRNEWKQSMWSTQEHIGIKIQKAASRTYYRAKWGIVGEVDSPCRYPETTNSSTGALELVQVPFARRVPLKCVD